MQYGKNHLGGTLTTPQMLADNSFGWYSKDGYAHPYWPKPDENVDKHGFDKRYKHISGKYIEETVLMPGTLLCRYGSDRGSMTTVYGTPYELLGLPYIKQTCPYHVYLVVKPIIVIKGIVAPVFNSPGGGIQLLHKRTIREELECDNIKEI